MNTVTITVADIRPPAPGKKQASVIDSTGKRWGIPPSEQNNYRQFGTYEITQYKTNEFQNKTYYTIEAARAVAAYGNGGADGSIQPSPRPSTGNAYTPPNDDIRRMDIFVCGGFNNIMANPCVNPMEISTEQMAEFARRLKQVWKLTLGPQAQEAKPAGSSTAEFNDDIPF